ncbi:MAG: M1 family metallopeptidase [Bacteroidota bacterium]|nr:M1 family metallopeptidase [Bacteroidota bacterium]MDP3143875.1 M1 family metallopeptidase [Bacteroidota bacterium]
MIFFKYKFYLPILIVFLTFFSFSQNEFIDYRSATNPLYWKNRKPFEGYWQQDVHYNIKAELNDSTDILTGNEELTYWNNSPYDISFVYFHLYSNAQIKDSYCADLYKNNDYNLKFGKYRSNGLGTQVEKITVNGAELKTELDNTILKVYFQKPLKSGESITMTLDFKTYFDTEAIRNRMKMFSTFGFKHYDIVHWYPRVAVIDSKFAWNTDQHMDHEFYGDFGSFNVEMTLPNNYVADGTGTLINEKEVLPDTLRKKLDISNFLKKPFNSPPSIITKKDGTKKTWKFSAINVHDFAFTADPTYRIGETNWDGVRCIALVQEPHAAGWYNCSNYIAKILEVNSYNIGPYHHPKMIVADAQDGMEYPMLTLCGGFDPGYRSLLIHEITHNWFQGMVGTNENYRAFMDEGFTQFYTADTYQYIDGPIMVTQKPKSNYVEKFTEPVKVLDNQIYNSFYYNAVIKEEELPLNTHSDDFNGAIRHGGGYGQVYTKTAAMLKNLEYVLGRSFFDKAMQHYFKQWKFCHPYPEDFRNSVIGFTGVDLNWFFDQWLETTKTVDYKIGRIKHKKNDVYEITFKRKGSMQMPIDFVVIDKNDSARHYYIPNTWFEKPTGANTLPRWIGWGPNLKPTYTATLNIGTKIKNVIIDPSYRLADVDMTNNVKHGFINVRFDSHVYNPLNWKKYDMRIRPALWYNGYDGAKFGAVLSGDYLLTKHVFEFGVWLSSGLGQAYIDSNDKVNSFNKISFLLDYKTSLNKYIKKSNVYLQLKSLDGLDAGTIGFEKRINNNNTRLYTHLKAMLRDMPQDMVYLINDKEWGYRKLNSAIHIGLEHNYKYKRGVGNILLNLRSAAFTNDYDFSAATITSVNKNDLGKININTRVFGQIGFGNSLPSESMLYVAGANNEDLMDNKYTRSMGIVPRDWGNYGTTTNHFTSGGGLGLRGFSGYLLAQKNADGSFSYNYKGASGAAFNTEIEFGELFKFMNPKFLKNSIKLQPYIFGDAGIINTNPANKANVMSDIMFDAGVGTTLSIVRWGQLYNIKPLTVRFDMPFFINRLPYAEKDYFQFRWMIGINKAF